METTKTRKKTHKLTEEEKLDLMNYIEANEKDHTYTNTELAEMFDISYATLSIYKSLVRKKTDNKDTEVVVKKDEEKVNRKFGVVKVINSDATPYVTNFDEKFGIDTFAGKMKYYTHHGDCVEVGLVNNRHDIPVKNYIFNDSLSEELMFDYAEQEKIVQDFIDKHCTYKKKIILYATGLQSALSSVIKICIQNNIDISIKHYNAESKSYILQPLIGTFENNIIDPFFDLSQCKHGLFFYKCTQKELETYDGTFYSIKFADLDDLDSSTDKNKKDSGHILVKNYEDIFDILPTMIKSMMTHYNQRLAIYVNKCYIKDGSFRFGFCFSKNYSSNLSKEWYNNMR